MKTGISLLRIAVALAVAVSVSSAMAQGGKGGKGGGRGGFGVSPIALVKVEAVQSDLALSSDQKDKVAKLEDAPPDFSASQEERQKARDEAKAKVDEILLPPQRERLAEISLQLEGVRALRRPEVATKLKLTDDQKQKIDEALAAGGGGGKGKGGGKGGGFGRMTPEQEAAVTDILTADQKSEFTSMQGKKIEIDRTQLFQGMGRKGGKGNKGGKAPDA